MQSYLQFMGCLSSKPQTTTQGDVPSVYVHTISASGVPVAQPQQDQRPVEEGVAASVGVARKPASSEHRVTTSSVQEWIHRPEDLKNLILNCNPVDERTVRYLNILAELSKRSFRLRVCFGEPAVIRILLVALRDGCHPVVKASAHALRLLSFCLPNHQCASFRTVPSRLPTNAHSVRTSIRSRLNIRWYSATVLLTCFFCLWLCGA